MSLRDFCLPLDRIAEGQTLGINAQRLSAENLAGTRQIECSRVLREQQ